MNLFEEHPARPVEELVETLARGRGVRIERIVSRGQASAEDFWYDQAQAEFVAVLAGAARLEFADGELLDLRPGDWVNIAAHRRHRVAWTTPDEATVWLAVFYDAETAS